MADRPSGTLLLAGDPHGRFRRILRAARAMRPAAVGLQDLCDEAGRAIL